MKMRRDIKTGTGAEVPIPKIGAFRLLLALLFVPGLYLMLIVSACIPLLTILGIYLFFRSIDFMPIVPLVVLGAGAVFGFGASVFGILKALFRRPDYIFATPLAPKGEGEFREFVGAICREMRTRRPGVILLNAGPEFFVTQGEVRGPFGTCRGRILSVGVASLSFLTRDELRAILAHEFAHFTGGETTYSALVLPVYEGARVAVDVMGGMIRSESRAACCTAVPLYLPYILLKAYVNAFVRLYLSISRKREIRADVIAARVGGADCYSRALKKVSSVAALFEALSGRQITNKLRKGGEFENYYEFLRQYAVESPGHLKEFEKRVLCEPEGENAAHPSLQVRLALMAQMPTLQKGYGASARSLFSNIEVYEKQLTELKTLVTRALAKTADDRQ